MFDKGINSVIRILKQTLTLILLLLFQLSCAGQYNISPEWELNEKLVVNSKAIHNGIETIVVMGDSPSRWQKVIMESGYNIVDRSKIETIIDEQKLSLAGLSKEAQGVKVGELVGADAILLTEITANTLSSIRLFTEEAKLVSVKTGEILFIANFNATFDGFLGANKAGRNKVKTLAAKSKIWREGLLSQYKDQVEKDIQDLQD